MSAMVERDDNAKAGTVDFSGEISITEKGIIDIKVDNVKELSKKVEQLQNPSPSGEDESNISVTANKDDMNESTDKQSSLAQSSTIASDIQGGPAKNISNEQANINSNEQNPIKAPDERHGGKRRTRSRKSSRRKQKGSSRRNRRKSNKRKRRNKK